ncbi:MAG: 2-oxo acid dehydrogenase subunit E2 [Magnetococcales bacterium]|nr:2-oxo acid dehydrogenase subunit E2 [Magnetococcales bacterium]
MSADDLLEILRVPQEGANDEFVVVVELPVAHGSRVEVGELIAEIETSKAVVEVVAGEAGHLALLCHLEDQLPIGREIARIQRGPVTTPQGPLAEGDAAIGEPQGPLASPMVSSGAATASAVSSAPAPAVSPPKPTTPPLAADIRDLEPVFSREAVGLIQETGLARDTFKGRDFVRVHDVRLAAGLVPATSAASTHTPVRGATPATELSPAPPVGVTVKPLTATKQAEIRHLEQVQSAGLNSQVHTLVDPKGCLAMMARELSVYANTIAPEVIRLLPALLGEFPEFNARFLGGQEGIGFHDQVQVGLALNLEDGLKVVGVPGEAMATLQGIEGALFELVEKYMQRKLKPADMNGITFTLTDLSMSGVFLFNPLIGAQQSAILGISSLDDGLGRLVLSLTFDHRVADGKRAAEFLGALKERIEAFNGEVFTGQAPASETMAIHCHRCHRSLRDEKRDGGVGLLQVVTPDGSAKHLCRLCLEGW